MKTRVTSFYAFVAVILVSCTDVNHEHNFAELIDANYKFRTPQENEIIRANITSWALKHGFTKKAESDDLVTYQVTLSPDEDRFYSKLFIYFDAHGSNSMMIELKTDRWGTKSEHRKQKIITDALRGDFEKLFPGNFRINIVSKVRDGVKVSTNEHVPLDDSFPGIR